MSIVNQSNKAMLFELLKSIGAENNFSINDEQLVGFINQNVHIIIQIDIILTLVGI